MTSFLTEYLDCILAYMRTDSHPAWKEENAVVVDLQAAPYAVKQFVTNNAIKPAGHGLVLPNEKDGVVTDYSVDGAACPHCGTVDWMSLVVCPACIDQLGDGAGPSAPICCWRCAPTKYDDLQDRPEHASRKEPHLVGCHAPLVVQRLSNGRVYSLVAELKTIGDMGSD